MENVLVLPPLLFFLSACKLGAILSPGHNASLKADITNLTSENHV